MDPDQNSLPPFLVDAVIKLPYGAHPTACAYFYDYDVSHLNLYKDAAKDPLRFTRYLDDWITGVPGHETYLEKIGVGNLVKIKANPVLGYAPGLDRR
jgi:glutaconate CoA-transferase subunit A